MSIDNRSGLWVPGRELELLSKLDRQQLSIGMLGLSQKPQLELFQMEEFPFGDPWSEVAGRAIADMAKHGQFSGKKILEFGVGAGPQTVRVGNEVEFLHRKGESARASGFIGVDIEASKLGAAYLNFQRDPVMKQYLDKDQIQLYDKHAIEFLDNWDQDPFNGVAIMCLPQAAPGDHKNVTTSDVVGNDKYVMPYLERWGPTALQLNAGVLSTLAWRSDSEARALLILSGRISEKVREELIQENGWQVDDIAAQGLVQQDSDTPLDWMLPLGNDEKGQLYDKDGGPIAFDEGVEMHNKRQPVMHEVFGYNIIRT